MRHHHGSKQDPLYGWALDQQGGAVPIHAALRGVVYRCPVCHGEMVAKLGDIKQHHFAHVNLLQCTPENVTKTAAALWLVEQLRQKLARHEPARFTWEAADGLESHPLDLLAGVASISHEYTWPQGFGDVVLLGPEGQPKVLILISVGEHRPGPELIREWVRGGLAVLDLDVQGLMGGTLALEPLLATATCLGVWHLLPPRPDSGEFIQQPDQIGQALRLNAHKPPYGFYGPLLHVGGRGHVLLLGDQKLWLPPEVWEVAVGGDKNRLAPGLSISVQEWPEVGGGKIRLFYVRLNETAAVAVRFFPAGAPPEAIALQNTSFRLAQATAQDIAKQLAGPALELPL